MMRDARYVLYGKYRKILLEEPQTSWKDARARLNVEANKKVIIQLNINLKKAIENTTTNHTIHMVKKYLVDFCVYTLDDLTLDYEPIVF